jgi:molybdopterin converting factor small subunit
MIRVKLPSHLQNLAGVGSEIEVDVKGQATANSVLDAVEGIYPMLKGTIRAHSNQERRAYLRFFACKEDISHEPMNSALPAEVANGTEVFMVVGAISGG